MTVPLQTVTPDSGATATVTQLDITLANTTAGNLITFCASVDKDSGTLTAGGLSGTSVTVLFSESGDGAGGTTGRGVSHIMGYAIAEGGVTETIRISWPFSASCSGIGEEWPVQNPILDVPGVDNDSGVTGSTTNDITAGTTQAITQSVVLAILTVGVDSRSSAPSFNWNPSGTNAYGNAAYSGTNTSFTSAPATGMASKDVTGVGSTVTGRVSWVTLDEAVATLAVFRGDGIGATEAPSAQARGVGGVTETSAKLGVLCTDYTAPGQVRAKLGTNSALTENVTYTPLVDIGTNSYAIVEATNLAPDTKYWYAWEVKGVLVTNGRGSFNTFPRAGYLSEIRAAALSCFERDSNTSHYAILRQANWDAVLLTGDRFYEIAGENNNSSQAVHRSLHERYFAQPNAAAFYANVPVLACPDDHDWDGNGSDSTFAGIAASAAVWREIVPTYTLPHATAMYHAFWLGPIRVICLDTRSLRAGPLSGVNNDFLGSTQMTWFQNELLTYKNHIKCVISSVPYLSTDTTGDDWGRAQAQRTTIASYITTNSITNGFFLCGDSHACAYDVGDATTANWPVILAAPGDKVASQKGGPWDTGWCPPSGETQRVQQHVELFLKPTSASTATMTVRFRNMNQNLLTNNAGTVQTNFQTDKTINFTGIPEPALIPVTQTNLGGYPSDVDDSPDSPDVYKLVGHVD